MKLRNGLKLLLATVVISVTSSASAAFITTDWKVEGDSMVMTDQETGIEWLKLPQTFGLSVGEVRNNAYFDGWNIAQRDEVVSLVQRARAGDYTQFNIMVTESNYLSSYAMYDFDDGSYKMAGIATNGTTYTDYGTLSESFSRSDFGVWLKSDGGMTYSSLNDPTLNENNPNAPANTSGVGTVSVPEPATMAIFGLGLAGLAYRRKGVAK